MGTRFFSATAFCCRLYVQSVPERGPWDASQLVYWTEEQIDLIFNPLTGDRKGQERGRIGEGVGGVQAGAAVAEGLGRRGA